MVAADQGGSGVQTETQSIFAHAPKAMNESHIIPQRSRVLHSRSNVNRSVLSCNAATKYGANSTSKAEDLRGSLFGLSVDSSV